MFTIIMEQITTYYDRNTEYVYHKHLSYEKRESKKGYPREDLGWENVAL